VFDLWTHRKGDRCFCLDCRSTRWCVGFLVGACTTTIGALFRHHEAPSFWYVCCGGLVLTAIFDVLTVRVEEESDDDGATD
jgi:hypothetical protein